MAGVSNTTLNQLTHYNYPRDDSDGFNEYDFHRCYNEIVEYFVPPRIQDMGGRIDCYTKSAQYRALVAETVYGNHTHFLLENLQRLIRAGRIHIMDKEGMTPWRADSAMLYQTGILIAHPR